MFNILVVEDDRAVAAELVESLRLMGHRAEWTGGQAPVTVGVGCDLVLLDLGLGASDGFEVLEQIACGAVRPPVAIVSGRDGRIVETARDLARARGLRFVGALSKPFLPADIADLLDLLDAPQAIDAPLPELSAMTPYYAFQYKNHLGSGLPIGCEVLLRLPGISDIERWFGDLDQDRSFAMTIAAAEAAIGLHKLLAARGAALPVSFNCPPDIFREAAFFDALKSLSRDAGVAPAAIPIELTEQQGSGAMLDLHSMACRYSLAGVPVHLDDFGKGAASLEQLLKLPLSEVKIDRSVFRNLAQNGKAILFEISAFCRAHKIISTIEGIETNADLLIARAAGADNGQGFLWSRPIPIADLARSR